MKIVIETIEHRDQRYPTVGDWFEQDGVLQVKVSSLGDWRYEILVALHEVIEQSLCRQEGVTEAQVDEFDLAHLDADDPGSHPEAPYRTQHEFATAVEMLIAQRLGVDWAAYDTAVKAL